MPKIRQKINRKKDCFLEYKKVDFNYILMDSPYMFNNKKESRNMTIQINYKTKKELKNNIGNELNYTETSIFGDEYKENGTIIGCDLKRKFFAKITIENNIIKQVS